MARSTVLALLLLALIIASQFEWKQQFGGNLNQNTSGNGEKTMKKEDSIREKIILLQEKRIQRLEKLVHGLQQQLLLCRGGSGDDALNGFAAGTPTSEPDNHAIESMHALIND